MQHVNTRMKIKMKIEKEISNLVSKGYARKLTSGEVSVKIEPTWYLSIFITTNPNKPARIRLVWDAIAKANGFSLNDFLLSGPDLLTFDI